MVKLSLKNLKWLCGILSFIKKPQYIIISLRHKMNISNAEIFTLNSLTKIARGLGEIHSSRKTSRYVRKKERFVME